MTDRAASTAGFTLMELLIAMTLTTMVLVSVSMAFGFGMRVWKKETGREIDRSIYFIDLFRSQLGCWFPLDDANDELSLYAFSGDEFSFGFTTTYSVKALDNGPPAFVRYVYDEGEQMLFYGQTPLRHNHPEEMRDFLEEEPNTDDEDSPFYGVKVEEFAFQYRDKRDPEDLLDEWEGEQAMLDAVVMTMVTEEDGEERTYVFRPDFLTFSLPR